jgi:hypothetical protein
MNQEPLFEKPDGPPRLVMWAVVGMSCVFLCAGILLMRHMLPWGKIVVEERIDPKFIFVVYEYQGPIWLINHERKKLKQRLQNYSGQLGRAVTIFPESPLKLRPLRARGWIGFEWVGKGPESAPGDFRLMESKAGHYLRITIPGSGNYTGNRALAAAGKKLGIKNINAIEGERYEIINDQPSEKTIEHWIPYHH